MHGRMSWADSPHKHYSGAGFEMDVPMVSVPMAFFALVVGMMLGVMVGHKKAMMHGMMGGGMRHGMMGGGMRGGYGWDGDWMARKKAMMRGMGMHHHHGYGAAPCMCGSESEGAGMHEGGEQTEDTER